MVALTYAAAVTSSIRVGVSVVVLPLHHPAHVAHHVASLDYVSGGRAVLGVGLGREQHYGEFQAPAERRVRRFREGIELMKALWTQARVDYDGEIYRLHGGEMQIKPLQRPHVPIWLGGVHPDAVRRAATLADGWMGSGNMSSKDFIESVPVLKAALEQAGRDPASFPISKRVFMAVDEKPEVARAMVHRWFSEVYRNPNQTDTSGVHGTPEQVREQLEALIDAGANHLLLNSVSRFSEQLEALAELTGLGD
jgi:probable F420-dependent oxidoreductase